MPLHLLLTILKLLLSDFSLTQKKAPKKEVSVYFLFSCKQTGRILLKTYLVKGKTFSQHKVFSSIPRTVEGGRETEKEGSKERKRIGGSKRREKKGERKRRMEGRKG